ncbi:MAG: hypothetical protein QOJ63_92 [Solirubrobacteraceae bacterium]|jgi:hypothetical protein|nr:hypothetical protein [Solirubrobacteraceae bacterium]
MRWTCVVAALGAATYLLLEPASADLAAQTYRVGLVRTAGPGLWDNGWFGGHHTPAYSLLSPPLGAAIGVRLAGALAALAASALFALIARRHWGERAATIAAPWFAAGAVATLLSGRLTFLLGVAVGLAAMLALQRAHHRTAAALAATTTLCSPVAGLFVAIAAVAWALADSRRRARGALVAGAALTPAVLLGALFAEGGTEPFAASSFWPALVATALVAAALPARERALRAGAALYALACVAAFVVPTPLGGNVTRLGALLAGPVAIGALLAARTGGWRRALAIALVAPLAYWQAYPAVRDVERASGDPSTTAAYHARLVRFLEGRPGSFRVEIPLTENHWEAAHVAPSIPLARGWERQLDRRYGALFYDGSLDGARYRAWLDELAVAYVAVPDVPLDYSARAEARLIADGLPYLRPVWHDAHWRVFAVRRPAPLVAGAASAIDLGPDGFAIRASRAGDAFVRVRHTHWWAVTGGRACVERGSRGMTRVHVLAPGTVRVQARLLGSSCRR